MSVVSEKVGADDPLGKVVRVNMLIDLYGGLLTDRQRTFVQMHYGEDLSFGEIARSHGVSRQAIHDAVKHAEASLEDYESKLRLLDRGISKAGISDGNRSPAAAEESVEQAAEAPGAKVIDVGTHDHVVSAASRLRGLQERLKRSGGVIYNADGIMKEVAEIADILEELQ